MKFNDGDNRKVSSSQFICSSNNVASENDQCTIEKHDEVEDMEKPKLTEKKPGGWKAMPYVLGNETSERLASFGLLMNFQVFLMRKFNMDQVSAANVIYIWSGVGNFAPLIGAYISDVYTGRFRTIAFASFPALLGMLTMTLIAWLPQLRPPPCNTQQLFSHQCIGPTKFQLGILIMALGFMSIGSGGIRPCSIPFGVDQFDSRTEQGRKGINSYFNWYYTSFTLVLIVTLTLVVYVQDSVSWVLGFGLPTIFMACGIVLFFAGMRVYVYVKPEGSVFSGILQAIVAAYKKRKVELPGDGNEMFYDPPLKGTSTVKKLALTTQFRWLNKAAIKTDGDINVEDGTLLRPWRLASVQQIEEVKCLLRIIPIWASGIICFMAMAQQGTFTISQALKMDRHLGHSFQIPAGSLMVISMITVGVWLPFYDRVLVPSLRKITKVESGITLLQRMGIGIIFSILSMIAAGLTERMRRSSAIMHNGDDGIAPITVMWLAPQLILMGFAEAFNILGQIEFYNKEFPENMSSVANSLFSCTMGGANYMSSALVNIVHNLTATRDHPDWLTKDINAGRVENFYFVIAGMGVLNFVYFLVVARRYRYKSRVRVDEDDDDVELNAIKR